MEYKLEIRYNVETNLYEVELFIPETGEVRECHRTTIESAMRALGRTLDRDFRGV